MSIFLILALAFLALALYLIGWAIAARWGWARGRQYGLHQAFWIDENLLAKLFEEYIHQVKRHDDWHTQYRQNADDYNTVHYHAALFTARAFGAFLIENGYPLSDEFARENF